MSLVNLGDGQGIKVSGDIVQGDFIELSLAFSNGETVRHGRAHRARPSTSTPTSTTAPASRRRPGRRRPRSPPTMTYELVLLRHGESEWNAKNLFTGWVDVDLNDKGRGEAVRGGELLREADLLPDVLHTSLLRRAITTAHLALDARDRHWIPVRRSWRLNERHYGAPAGQGQEADDGGVRRGAVHALAPLLRRPAAAASPTTTSSPRSATRGTPTSATRCPAPSASRTSSRGCCPTGTSDITADLRAGQRVLVAAHGNSLRALVKHLDQISDEDIAGLNIPTGMPLLYRLDEDLRPDRRRRRVPRPGRRRRRRRRRRQPGALTLAERSSAVRRDPERVGLPSSGFARRS